LQAAQQFSFCLDDKWSDTKNDILQKLTMDISFMNPFKWSWMCNFYQYFNFYCYVCIFLV